MFLRGSGVVLMSSCRSLLSDLSWALIRGTTESGHYPLKEQTAPARPFEGKGIKYQDVMSRETLIDIVSRGWESNFLCFYLDFFPPDFGIAITEPSVYKLLLCLSYITCRCHRAGKVCLQSIMA